MVTIMIVRVVTIKGHWLFFDSTVGSGLQPNEEFIMSAFVLGFLLIRTNIRNYHFADTAPLRAAAKKIGAGKITNAE